MVRREREICTTTLRTYWSTRCVCDSCGTNCDVESSESDPRDKLFATDKGQLCFDCVMSLYGFEYVTIPDYEE